jgi:ribosomal protein S18 acetylase RimI-like enzyme
MASLTHIPGFRIRSQQRRRGFGRALLLHVARLAQERGCGRLEWAALDWNELAINFYKKLGGIPMSEWTVFRISGVRLYQMAKE